MSTQSERDTPTVPAYTEAPTVNSQNFQENIDYTPAEAEAPPSRPESPKNLENFEPEIKEEGSRDDYHQGANAFSQSQISESKEFPDAFHYNGEDYLLFRPSRNIIIAENDDYGLIATIKRALITGEDIPFMSLDIEEYNEYINNISHYVLRLYGYLVNGQKAVVTISGIKVFFDIRVPDNEKTKLFESKIRDILTKGKNDNRETDYQPEKKTYLRIVTTTSKQRKIALDIILKHNSKIEETKRRCTLETASDDTTAYYRKVAREYRIPLSGWCLLTNYEYNNGRMPYSARSPLCEHAFYVPINNFCHIEDLTVLNKTYPSQLITYDRALVLAWDIETHSTLGLDHFPYARYKEDNIFMICMTVYWKDDPTPLKQICLVDVETTPDPNWITIICGNERNLLKAFALCWRALAPDIELTFNGFKYDWPFVVERATQLKILDWMVSKMSANSRKKATIDSILRWNYYGGVAIMGIFQKENKDSKKIKNREEVEIKIDSEEYFKSTFLKVPGCVLIDVLVCCKKLYPKSEKKSLNDFLGMHGLDSKIDLPIKVMREYYTQSKENTSPETAKNMRKIADYCILDSLSCQRLIVKRNVINDYREVASIAYVSLFNSHYYAGGMKVCNLLGAEAWKRDILVTMIASKQTESGKYPGAYVFPPIKGLENKRPVTELDFASLYPSLIMTYNLSPEMMTLLSEETVVLEKAGECLHKIELLFNSRILYAWSIRHENKNNKMRLYPSVLVELFNKRNKMKALLEVFKKKLDCMKSVKNKMKEKNLSLINAIDHILENTEDEEERGYRAETLIPFVESYTDFTVEYDSTCFEYKYLNSKQKAVKLYMNTFYGETGNSLSPFFSREFAGGVTSAGQYYIKLVAEYVTKKKGFGVKYGDTDSLYLTCPDECYKECDIAYNNVREYWTEMVKITMGIMKKLRDDVNKYLRLKSRSTYFKMAYEEVLFPVCFTGKKKYFGIPHEKKVNFKPDKDKLFIKGIDTVKQGKSQLFKTIGERIMWGAMNIDNTHSLHRIVEDVLKEAITNPGQWSFEQFIETDTWKPNVDNKCVQCFIKRMRVKHENKIPDPGERFSYVLKQPKGDRMEFVDVAKELGKSIDLSHYFENTIIGLCARFIMYDKKYEPLLSDKIMQLTDLDEKYKQIDSYAQEKVKKWLESFIKEINVVSGVTPQMMVARGYAYKRAYKGAEKRGREMLSKKIRNIYEALQGDCINYEHFICGDPISEIWENLVKYIKTIKREELGIKKPKRIEILISLDIEGSICSNLMKHIDTVKKIAIKYNSFFHKLVYHMRYKEHIAIPDKIGVFETMRKNEIIIEQPTLPRISEAERLILESFQNTWKESVNIFYASCEVKIC
ncbi:hypothetical protein Glove_566g69 [Diversispora epigaea]|uniref:DNA polymerase n=1 Tax=Diversispora epigaea TaxID=1348612 RepID=A0A397GA00_9GLOM|nr:hypothetical protein Glove_566g69 [Diversispora epigaea]